ncbi:hypothetical protein PCAR4_1140025 [Paraburkholderia caribensis]|nr:hypothetical protein PCAR4_1140025 [Paraburkholderia caribensis]
MTSTKTQAAESPLHQAVRSYREAPRAAAFVNGAAFDSEGMIETSTSRASWYTKVYNGLEILGNKRRHFCLMLVSGRQR